MVSAFANGFGFILALLATGIAIYSILYDRKREGRDKNGTGK